MAEATVIPLALALRDGRIKAEALSPIMLKKIKALGPLVMGGESAPPSSPMTPSVRGKARYKNHSPVRATHAS